MYDSMQRPLTMLEQGDALFKATSYAYDVYGRLSELTKPDGVTLHHTYDALGRLATLTSSDNTLAYRYVYDLHGNPIETTDLNNPTHHQASVRSLEPYGERSIGEWHDLSLCL